MSCIIKCIMKCVNGVRERFTLDFDICGLPTGSVKIHYIPFSVTVTISDIVNNEAAVLALLRPPSFNY